MTLNAPAKLKNFLPRKGRYWARVAVPEALRPIIGKRELTEPLGPDLMMAKRKLPGVVARMHEELEEARGQLVASQRPIAPPPRQGRVLSVRNLAKAHYEAELAKHDAARRADRSRFADTLRFEDETVLPFYADKLRGVVNGLASNEEANALIGWAIDDFRERGNTKATFGTAEWRELAQAFAAIQLETMRVKAAHDQGDFAAQPAHPLLVQKPVANDDPLRARIIGPDSERTLSDLVEQFIAEKPTTKRIVDSNRTAVRLLEEIIGEPLPIYRLARAHVHAFKRALAGAPSNAGKRFPGMTLAEATKANKVRLKPHAVLDSATIDRYLSRLHTILNWAVKNDIVPDNAASGIKVDVVKAGQPPRVNFSPDDLGRLFGEHFASDGKWGEREWAMAISLFTGLRASELAQVKLNSIRTERGVLVIAVEEETKNLGSQRLVPVHSKLLALGFEDYVAGLRKRRATHLFADWYRKGVEAKQKSKDATTAGHLFPAFLPRRFNESYLPKVGIDDDRKSWHSFRHSFKSSLKMAGVPKDMRDELAGHSDNSAGAGYEHGQPVEAMKLAIEKLSFDGFSLGN